MLVAFLISQSAYNSARSTCVVVDFDADKDDAVTTTYYRAQLNLDFWRSMTTTLVIGVFLRLVTWTLVRALQSAKIAPTTD